MFGFKKKKKPESQAEPAGEAKKAKAAPLPDRKVKDAPPYLNSQEVRQDIKKGKKASPHDRLKDAISGALYGMAVGDALGAPVEHMPPAAIVEKYGRVSSMIAGGWLNLKPGETTEETNTMLLVAKGITSNMDFPIPAVGRRFLRWMENKPRTADETFKSAVELALKNAELMLPSVESQIFPESIWYGAAQQIAAEGKPLGNNALPRALYAPLFYETKKRAVEVSILQGQMTHWDNDSVEACRVYSEVLCAIIADDKKMSPKNDGQMRTELAKLLAPTRFNLNDMPATMEKMMADHPEGAPSDPCATLLCALFSFFTTTNAREALEVAVNMGGDADGVGAVCGGLVGAYYGYNNLPLDWVSVLDLSLAKRLNTVAKEALANQTSAH